MATPRRIDLTHRMKNAMAVWPTHPPFRQETVESIESGGVSCNHSLCMSEHTGTHFDAPLHFVVGGQPICDVPLERFFGRMVTIDARSAVPRSEIGPELLSAFEREHGKIRQGDAVLFRLGWAEFWDDPLDNSRFLRDWPGLSRATCELLVERKVSIVGADAMSVDRFGTTDFPAHNTLLRAGILIGENFANLDRVPPICSLIALPLPIENGSGAPMRAVALLDES
jgi:kynurenine formamidase